MRTIILAILAGLTAGCGATASYWDRPGASLSQVARESEECYRVALDEESPSAFASLNAESKPEGRLLRRSNPPPALWKRSPRQAAFEHYGEQLRYERCMRARGWVPAGWALIPQ